MSISIAHADTKVSGKKVFKRCGFKYSNPMKNSDIIWNDCTLDKFLKKPRKHMKGTKMMFSGLKKKSHREAVIKYLKENQVK